MHDQLLKKNLEHYLQDYSPIIKNVGFLPNPVAGKIPDFANSILYPEHVGSRLYMEFWEDQIDRCINGYKTGGLRLPGPYYQYLNFTTIDGPRGPILPYFVDLHYQIAVVIQEIKKHHLPGIILPKKRRAGLSFLGAMIFNNGIRFIDRYRAGVAAGLDTYCDGFRLKLYRIYNITSPELMINHLLQSDDHFQIGYEEATPVGFQKTIHADVFFKTMKDKAEKMEGEYFNDVILEEAGQFPLVNETRESILPALKDGEDFVGTFYIFGTGGNMQKSSKQFREIWHSADVLGLVKFFIGGPRYYVPYIRREEGKVVTPNIDAQYPDQKPEQLLGCEDVPAALERIKQDNDEYAKLPDKKSYIKNKQAYPITVDDVFTSSGSNDYNVEKLYSQAYLIESQLPKYQSYTLDLVKNKDGDLVLPLQVRFNLPNEKTKPWDIVKVLRMPMPLMKNLDIMGVDGYNEDKVTIDSTKSQGAIVVLRQFNKFPFLKDELLGGLAPILLYYQRPPRKEDFWLMGVKISVAYNTIRNTMISAESDAMIQFYKDFPGAEKFLSRRPKSFDAPKSKLLHDFGVKMTAYSKPKTLGIVQSWIEDYVQYCWFIEMINDLIAYDKDNIGTDWDSADALGNGLIRCIDMALKPKIVASEEKKVNSILPRYTVNSEGEIMILHS